MIKIRSAYVVCDAPEDVVQFYTALLGTAPAFADGDKWIQFPSETGRFAISSPGEAASPNVNCVVVFEVNDITAVSNAALMQGGKIIGERDMGSHGRTMALMDPAGNVIQLFQPAAKD